jgi:hypothetical protein
VREDERFIREFCGYVELSLESDVRNGERFIYLVYDFIEGLKFLVLYYYCIKCER